MAGFIPLPEPAALHAPEWFRELPLDTPIRDEAGRALRSMSACLPICDAFALGWMLPLPFDLGMSRTPEGELAFHWAEGVPFQPVELMNPAQIGGDHGAYPETLPLKFINPWRISMPEGWSAAILHPLNRDDLPFRVWGAVLDLDVLKRPVNIPFRWVSPERERLLPAGTPIAQVVPFRRDLVPLQADIRAETEAEALGRMQPSHYAQAWRARHEDME
jgi:hypothetical protein